MKLKRFAIVVLWVLCALVANFIARQYTLPWISPVTYDLDRTRNNAIVSDREQTEMLRTWEQLTQKIEKIAPGELERLADPVAQQDLQLLENRLGVRLPEDFRRWLQLHDGSSHRFGHSDIQRSFCIFMMLNAREILKTHQQRAADLAEDFGWDYGFSMAYDHGDWSPAIVDIGFGGEFYLGINVETGELHWTEYGNPGRPHSKSFTAYLQHLNSQLDDHRNYQLFSRDGKRFLFVSGWGTDQ